MSIIKILSVCLALIIFSSYESFAKETPNNKKTEWSIVNKSLGELLNEGWRITNHGTSRSASNTTSFVSASNGQGRNNWTNESSFDNETFTFVLSRDNKYIICLINNPSLAEGTYSRCRSLN
jgi:hypothetical protein